MINRLEKCKLQPKEYENYLKIIKLKYNKTDEDIKIFIDFFCDLDYLDLKSDTRDMIKGFKKIYFEKEKNKIEQNKIEKLKKQTLEEKEYNSKTSKEIQNFYATCQIKD